MVDSPKPYFFHANAIPDPRTVKDFAQWASQVTADRGRRSGITQEMLADIAGCSKQRMSQLINGRPKKTGKRSKKAAEKIEGPNPEYLKNLADYFGIRRQDMLRLGAANLPLVAAFTESFANDQVPDVVRETWPKLDDSYRQRLTEDMVARVESNERKTKG